MENLVKKIHNKEKFFTFVMDQSEEAIIITSINLEIIYINKAAEKIFGYTKKEVLGKNPDILNAEDTSQIIQHDIEKTVRSGQKWEGTIKNKRKDGTLFYIHLVAMPYKEEDKIICYVGFQKDIDDLVFAKKELEISTDKYKTIFESAPDYINLVNKDGIIIDSNLRSEEILGYKKEELIGHHYSKIIHPEYLYKAAEYMNSLVSGCKTKKAVQEYKMIQKNGKEIIVDARTTCLLDRDGNFLHTICFITDISDRKRKEHELAILADSLRKSNEDLEQFAYLASHDLQEPLRVVSSYCQILKESCSQNECVKTKETDKYFGYVLEITLRMKNLICDLLDFSRAGREEKPFEKINLFDLVNEVLSDLEVSITESDADIFVDEDLPELFVVPFRFKQVFANLIGNSLKFRSNKKPIIEIGFNDKGDNWEFYVKDNGIGIEKKHFNRIFGIFKRLYPRDKYPGSGIGLAICKKIIENHGGKIWVESECGQGTCIFFTTPKIKRNGKKNSSSKK